MNTFAPYPARFVLRSRRLPRTGTLAVGVYDTRDNDREVTVTTGRGDGERKAWERMHWLAKRLECDPTYCGYCKP